MPEDKLSQEDLIRIRNEIVMAEKLNEKKLLPSMIECIQRFTGKYIPSIAVDWDVVLNEIYPIIQYELPSIYFRNPRVFLKPRNKTYICKKRNPMSGAMESVEMDSSKSARTQEDILNYLLYEIRYKKEVQDVLLDALIFPHGVLWHGYKGEFGMTEEQSLYIEEEQIFVKRLSPMNFLFDPTGTIQNLDECRWIGRSFHIAKKDLLEDETLDVDKKQIKGEVGYSYSMEPKGGPNPGGNDTMTIGSSEKTLIDYADKEFKTSDNAKFIKCYEIFQRPSKKEKRAGEIGKIILLCKDQEKPLRVSKWPYKAKGFPAEVLMFNRVPDGIFGMSDIDVYGKLTDQKNMVINLQLRNGQENSKTFVGISKEGANEEDIEKIRSGDQTLVFFESGDPRTRMFVQSAGGSSSNELYNLSTQIQNQIDEKSGIPDLKKGVLRSGEESATSVNIRNMGTNLRPAYRQDIMGDFLRRSCSFLNQLNKQFMPVDKAVRIVGSLDLQWSENPSKEEVQAETDVEMDVISMLPEDPEREIQELQMILNLMVQALNDPALTQKIQQEGKTFELSPIIEAMLMRLRIRNPDVFRNIKPEESQGYVSVSELRAASGNVKNALSGQQPSSPPAPGQDHRGRLEVYGEISQLISSLGDTISKKILDQLMTVQSAIMQEEEQKQTSSSPKKVNMPGPKLQTMGAS